MTATALGGGMTVASGRSAWRAHLAVLTALWAAMLLLFRRDVAAIVDIWWTSSTFGHCLFLPPILAWLVWQRKDELAALTPRGWWPGLLIVAAGALGWLAGQAASVAVARHFGLLLMLQGAVVGCLGLQVTRGLLFPLGYAVFLVPFGEELVPPLQTLTAKMCMTLLGWAGVPATIEGVFITIPNGWFEVAEACSGVKFLIAMACYGALVANIWFPVLAAPEIAFMAAALIIPVLANGIRAFATIWVAHLTSAKSSVGFDHVVYGWFFFAAVLAGVMALAWPFFDRRIGEPWLDPRLRDQDGAAVGSAARVSRVALAALLIAATPLVWSEALARLPARLPAHIELPVVPGWQRIALDDRTVWRPRFTGADHHLLGRYRDVRGRTVDLAIFVYGRQEEGREIVGYGQGAVDPAGAWAWTDDSAPPPGGRAFRISAPGPTAREVAVFYRIGGTLTGSEASVKLATLRTRLLGGPQQAVAVLVSGEERAGKGSARPAIDALLQAVGPIDRLADAAAGR